VTPEPPAFPQWQPGMLKRRRSLKVDFAAWIAVALLVCFVLPLVGKVASCDSTRQQDGVVAGVSAAQSKRPTQRAILPAPEPEAAEPTYRKYLERSGFCEAKLTDFAVVFLTSCLVIVGWFTIISGERNAKEMERPYIFGTPQIDASKSSAGHTFIEINLQNYGRTPGTVEIIYGEGALTEPFGVPLYQKGSARAAGGMLPPTLGKPIRAPVTFECPVPSDFYFLGYVRYTDLFGESHVSRFSAKIFLDRRGIEAAGPQAFHDWN
jgi:hypothetical protein